MRWMLLLLLLRVGLGKELVDGLEWWLMLRLRGRVVAVVGSRADLWQVGDEGGAKVGDGPRWYRVGGDLELLELDGGRQAAVGVVVKGGLGEEGKMLSLGHVC